MRNESLLEVSPYETDNGNLIGRDPRKIGSNEFETLLPEASVGLRAIREKCVDCCGGSFSEVRKCVQTDCPLWSLRMGTKPRGLRESRGETIKDDTQRDHERAERANLMGV